MDETSLEAVSFSSQRLHTLINPAFRILLRLKQSPGAYTLSKGLSRKPSRIVIVANTDIRDGVKKPAAKPTREILSFPTVQYQGDHPLLLPWERCNCCRGFLRPMMTHAAPQSAEPNQASSSRAEGPPRPDPCSALVTQQLRSGQTAQLPLHSGNFSSKRFQSFQQQINFKLILL